MIKAIFFDFDGTLLSHTQKKVPFSTRRALDKLREKEIKRVLATGRHMLELAMLPGNDLDFDAYITLNGQLCLDAEKNVLFGKPITGADRESILRSFREKAMPVQLVEKDAMYCNFVDESIVAAQRAISTPIPAVREYTGGEIYQAVFYVEKEKESRVSERLTACKIARWNEHAVDIIPCPGGKADGIAEFLRRNNIDRAETMAFGDGENDIEMLQFAQTGIAMGNAIDAVKRQADFVTDSVDDDGVEKALIKLGII